jgi:helicase
VRWSRGASLPVIERELLEHQYVEVPNAGPVEQAARRTGDIIEAVIDIAMVVHRGANLGDLPELFPALLELGVPAGLVPVVRHLTVDLDRETWLDLARDGFDNAKAILDAPEACLFAHVGVLRHSPHCSEQPRMQKISRTRPRRTTTHHLSADPPL